MNKGLQDSLSSLENLIKIQLDCVTAGDPSEDYMHGMLNGLICAHSVFTGDSPRYYSKPVRKRNKRVRHKTLLVRKAKQ